MLRLITGQPCGWSASKRQAMYCALQSKKMRDFAPCGHEMIAAAVDNHLTICPNSCRYVPCEWGHAVLNIQDTIGMAVEFKYRYTDGT